jgi:hypothetical protein
MASAILSIVVTNPVFVSRVSEKPMSLYPNPTRGMVTIDITAAVEKIDIYNLHGIVKTVKGDDKTIDISDLAPGVYFVKIYSREGNYIGSLIRIQ